jgi:hypothetical protein
MTFSLPLWFHTVCRWPYMNSKSVMMNPTGHAWLSLYAQGRGPDCVSSPHSGIDQRSSAKGRTSPFRSDGRKVWNRRIATIRLSVGVLPGCLLS